MFLVSTTTDDQNQPQQDDVTLPPPGANPLHLNWATNLARLRGLIANRFTTGDWDASEDAEQLLAADAKAVRAMEALKAQKMAKAAGSSVKYKPDGENGDGGGIGSDSEEDEFDLPESESEGESGDGEGEAAEEEDPNAGFEKVSNIKSWYKHF